MRICNSMRHISVTLDSTHMNFCKTWDIPNNASRGESAFPGGPPAGSRASRVGREQECLRYCCLVIIRSFPLLTDRCLTSGSETAYKKALRVPGMPLLFGELGKKKKKKAQLRCGTSGFVPVTVETPPPSLIWPISTTCLRCAWRHQRWTDASPTSKEGDMEIKVSLVRLVVCLEL